MRPSRVLAVMRRDLAIEFAGRRGGPLVWIASFLLLMIAVPRCSSTEAPAKLQWRVSGDVPAELAAREDVVVVEPGAPDALVLVAPSEATGNARLVEGPFVPDVVRDTLDGLETHVKVERFRPEPFTYPKRSLFLALVATSILTGALSQSIPGERSQRTLESLLTASITRDELILGKWLAWGGFGATAALLSTLVTLVLGRQEPGLWVAAVPWVSMGTVALGFWLVRRARDVVGGATMAIRMLPAALTFLGLLSWWLGQTRPWLGAAVPLGGVLLASGDAWGGAVGPTLLAIAVTATLSLALLRATARDLEPEPASAGDSGLAPAALTAATAAVVWWTTVLGRQLWAAGGAPERTATLDPADGVTAGGIALLGLVAVRLARTPEPLAAAGFQRPAWRTWLLAVGAGLGARALTLHPLAPLVHGASADRLREALAAALHPGWAGPIAVVLSITGQEVLFRGWMRQRAGDVASAVLFALVVSPLDPLAGLLFGVMLARLADEAEGSVLPGIAARLLAAYAFVDQPDLLGRAAAPVALVLIGLLVVTMRPPTPTAAAEAA